jgi:hypothetical protein
MVIAAGTPKGVARRLSRWEFQLRDAASTLRAQIERRCFVDIGVVKMVVTCALLSALAVEILLGTLPRIR